MKRWEREEDGFTLIEMIITIAISAVLIGSTIAAMGYISSGNAKRSAARFNAQLSTAQTETMMKKDPVYLYLYKDSGGAKTVLATNDYTSAGDLNTAVSSNAAGIRSVTEVGGKGVDVVASTVGGSTYTLDDTGSTMIKIVFDKATGAYKCANDGTTTDTRFFAEIRFSGRENYKVTLVEKTGKHVLNK